MIRAAQHIALFIPSLRGGGAERMILQVAEGLVRRGFKVELLVAEALGPYLKLVPEGVVVRDLGVGRVLAGVPCLVRYLREAQPDVLLSFMTHANLIALWARRLARVKTRLIISERNMLSFSGREKAKLKYQLLPFLARRCYAWSDGVIAVSSGVADDVAKVTQLPRSRVSTVYNPVVTPALKALSFESPDHPWFGQDDVPVVLGVGRLVPQKDFGTLLKAFAQLREERQVRLLLLGEGEQREALEAMVVRLRIADDVSMPGFVDNPFCFMRRASVFALSSAWEGLPGALIQAMACGCPVVSTDCPSGPREILRNGKHGRLIPVGDVDALSRAIGETLDNPVSPEQLVRRAQDFSQDVIVDQYVDVLLGPQKAIFSRGVV